MSNIVVISMKLSVKQLFGLKLLKVIIGFQVLSLFVISVSSRITRRFLINVSLKMSSIALVLFIASQSK